MEQSNIDPIESLWVTFWLILVYVITGWTDTDYRRNEIQWLKLVNLFEDIKSEDQDRHGWANKSYVDLIRRIAKKNGKVSIKP